MRTPLRIGTPLQFECIQALPHTHVKKYGDTYIVERPSLQTLFTFAAQSRAPSLLRRTLACCRSVLQGR